MDFFCFFPNLCMQIFVGLCFLESLHFAFWLFSWLPSIFSNPFQSWDLILVVHMILWLHTSFAPNNGGAWCLILYVGIMSPYLFYPLLFCLKRVCPWAWFIRKASSKFYCMKFYSLSLGVVFHYFNIAIFPFRICHFLECLCSMYLFSCLCSYGPCICKCSWFHLRFKYYSTFHTVASTKFLEILSILLWQIANFCYIFCMVYG